MKIIHLWYLTVATGILSMAISTRTLAGAGDSVSGEIPFIESTVVDPKVTVINGGFNPEFFGYRISGEILSGQNDCDSHVNLTQFHTWVRDGVLYIDPVVIPDRGLARLCPTIHEPVFGTAAIDIRYSRKEIQMIEIRRVGAEQESIRFTP
jgi:hypothetical protein